MSIEVKKSSYGNYSSSNYGVNTIRLDVGQLSLWFSYDTVVAFSAPGFPFRCCENCWQQTIGKHLNWIEPDKKKRISRDIFEQGLEAALKTFKLTL